MRQVQELGAQQRGVQMRQRAFGQCGGSWHRGLRKDAQRLEIGHGEVVRCNDLRGEGYGAQDDRLGLQEGRLLGLVGAFAQIVGLGVWIGFDGFWLADGRRWGE